MSDTEGRTSGAPCFRRLDAIDRPDVEQHLLALDFADRNARFHSGFGDTAVSRYVGCIDFDASILIGAVDQSGQRLIGLGEAHQSEKPGCVELAVSVLPAHRRQKLATRLLTIAAKVAFQEGAEKAELLFNPSSPSASRMINALGARPGTRFGHAVIHLLPGK